MKHSPDYIKRVRFSSEIKSDLKNAIDSCEADKVFFLFDENTSEYCRPYVDNLQGLPPSYWLVLKSGEENKGLEQVTQVWDFLEDKRAGRNSVIVSVGGGMLTDLGGFAACTFKRGMSFINIPTTLLAMVDASVGGKTGINYRGLKNEIGVIRQPNEVIIFAPFLESLNSENFKSGFAEMLKAGLIQDEDLWDDLVQYDLNNRNIPALIPLIWRSVQIKQDIVDLDPEEKAERRALNFGHTFAHAFESISLTRQDHILHGYAVAYGMIFESKLSGIELKLPESEYNEIVKTLSSVYGPIPFSIKDSQQLIRLMRSDKKNDNDRINITMLERIGKHRVNNYVREELIEKVLGEFLQD